MECVQLIATNTHNLLNRQGQAQPLSMLSPGVTVASSSVTASIAGTTLTVTVLASGFLSPGNVISGAGILPNTWIAEQLTGTMGGVGTYRLNQSNTFASGAVTADGSGLWAICDSIYNTFQACVDGTAGVQTATVAIDVSNDALHPVGTVLGTITLSGTISASDGFAAMNSWKYCRARVTAVTGTNAVVTCLLGS